MGGVKQKSYDKWERDMFDEWIRKNFGYYSSGAKSMM